MIENVYGQDKECPWLVTKIKQVFLGILGK